MKLMIESLVVFVLSLAAAALIAQGEPAFAELAVVDAAAATTTAALLWTEAPAANNESGARSGGAAENSPSGKSERSGAPWLIP